MQPRQTRETSIPVRPNVAVRMSVSSIDDVGDDHDMSLLVSNTIGPTTS
jgi:hypothetical protein